MKCCWMWILTEQNRRACANWTIIGACTFRFGIEDQYIFSHCNTMCAMYEPWGGATHCLQVCSESAGGPRWCWLRTCLGGIQWKDFGDFPTHQPIIFRRMRVRCVVVTSVTYMFVKVCYLYESYLLLFLTCLWYCMVSVMFQYILSF